MDNIRNTDFEIKQFNEEHKNDNSAKLPQGAAHRLVKGTHLNEFLTLYMKLSLRPQTSFIIN